MKKLLFTFVPSIMILCSCGGNNSAKVSESTKETVESAPAGKTSKEKITSCDEFLNKYENWVIDYLDATEDYMKNPTDIKKAQEYSAVGQEASNWSTEWTSLYECAQKEKYMKRFEEISKNIETELEKRGLK